MNRQQRAILQAVHELEPEAYGREVWHRTEEMLGRTLAVGSIYADLERFEEWGWVESWLDETPIPARSNRPRRCFRLTDAGVRNLKPVDETEQAPLALRPQLA